MAAGWCTPRTNRADSSCISTLFRLLGSVRGLTAAGGAEPRWSGDGREIFFRRGSEIHVVRPRLTGGVPEALSSERLFDAGAGVLSFDADRDAQRFLLNLPAPDSAPKPMTVIVNIATRLAELLPAMKR